MSRDKVRAGLATTGGKEESTRGASLRRKKSRTQRDHSKSATKNQRVTKVPVMMHMDEALRRLKENEGYQKIIECVSEGSEGEVQQKVQSAVGENLEGGVRRAVEEAQTGSKPQKKSTERKCVLKKRNNQRRPERRGQTNKTR